PARRHGLHLARRAELRSARTGYQAGTRHAGGAVSQVTRVGIERELELILQRDHPNPHHVLGAHPVDGGVVVRTYRPDALAVRVVPDEGEAVELGRIHPRGLFEGTVRDAEAPFCYRLEVDYPRGKTFMLDDPYRFLPTLGDLDLHLAGEGRHEELYARLGAHP